MAPVISGEIAAALRQSGATPEDFRAWCLDHGLTGFGSYVETVQWEFVGDFLRERGTVRPSMVVPSRSTLAAGSPALRSPGSTGKRVITRADGITEEIGLEASARRARERQAAKRAELDAAAASGRCGCDTYKMCDAHIRQGREIRERWY